MEWISVKDRLPGGFTDVLTWPIRDERYGSNIHGFYHPEDDVFYVECEDSYQCYDNEINVTNWMPLPEPPEK